MENANEYDPNWISVETTGKMLNLELYAIRAWIRKGHLESIGIGVNRRILLKDVEKALKNPVVMRRLEAIEKRQVIRKFAPKGEFPADPVGYEEAVRLLGIKRSYMRVILDQGEITIYLNDKKPLFHFSAQELLNYRKKSDLKKEARASKVKLKAQNRNMTEEDAYKHSKIYKKRLTHTDLKQKERCFLEWMTSRQVAAEFGICASTVDLHRWHGHLPAIKGSLIPGGRRQYLYRRLEVEKLSRDPNYIKYRLAWDNFLDPKNPQAESNRLARAKERIQANIPLLERRVARQNKKREKALLNEDNETRRTREAEQWVEKSKTLAWKMRLW